MSKYIVYGGTGSLGRMIIRQLLDVPSTAKVTVYSRDEAKHHAMRQEILDNRLHYIIGDVRDYQSVYGALKRHTHVIYAAALKQVDNCEYEPWEAILTNCYGANNVIQACGEVSSVEACVGVSTDKACKPVNAMGATKFLQERLFIRANLRNPQVKYAMVRLGNVVASTGSAIPIWQRQIAAGEPARLTDKRMRRFFMTRSEAASAVIYALHNADGGDIIVKTSPACSILELVMHLGATKVVETGIRPGEKLNEELISESESLMGYAVRLTDDYVAIRSRIMPISSTHHKPTGQYDTTIESPIDDIMQIVREGLAE